MSEVCHDVCVEPTLQPLTGEQLSYATAYREDSARLDVRAGGFWGLSQQSALLEIGQMLRDIAWREVKKGWEAEAQERSKLKVLQGLLANGGKARCMDVNCKRRRRVLAKLRGGTAALRIETGRWSGLKREERSCR